MMVSMSRSSGVRVKWAYNLQPGIDETQDATQPRQPLRDGVLLDRTISEQQAALDRAPHVVSTKSVHTHSELVCLGDQHCIVDHLLGYSRNMQSGGGRNRIEPFCAIALQAIEQPLAPPRVDALHH